jgi:hypothetical protein
VAGVEAVTEARAVRAAKAVAEVMVKEGEVTAVAEVMKMKAVMVAVRAVTEEMEAVAELLLVVSMVREE